MSEFHNKADSQGVFVISLDFELFWGLRDARTLEEYGENILGVRKAIPSLLDYFVENKIHATWAVVGFLFFDSKKDLVASLPSLRPTSTDAKLDPYGHIQDIGEGELDDPYHYGPSLINKIAESPFQEIGTHTFAHFTRWGDGRDEKILVEDLEAAKRAAARMGLELKSLVFPRNHFNESCLSACRKVGIESFRGNKDLFEWGPMKTLDVNHMINRGKRLFDTYFPFANSRTFDLKSVSESRPYNIPHTRFLKPYSRRLRFLEPLKIRKIKSDLSCAARKGSIYHIYFHPHNFGVNQKENMDMFKDIAEHFSGLREKYGMKSMNMMEVAKSAGDYANKKACTAGG
ncbi:MAG: polysaccharide deacetylase family protein [Nitrospina sp.]|jgi:peptidoglycan/xylan/chitin deacetylase (PgdA/CDA1 family)|nr:polysaccharide deacetylase family protein [Nitrospina sp.]MBT7196280.1 polysaccharide deacetylase family protein [Nitrospina sp.]